MALQFKGGKAHPTGSGGWRISKKDREEFWLVARSLQNMVSGIQAGNDFPRKDVERAISTLQAIVGRSRIYQSEQDAPEEFK